MEICTDEIFLWRQHEQKMSCLETVCEVIYVIVGDQEQSKFIYVQTTVKGIDEILF